MNKKNIIIFSSIILVFVFSFFIFKMVDKRFENLYGTVIKVDNDKIRVKTIDGYTYEVKTSSEVNEGDFININYQDGEYSADVILENDEFKNIEKNDEQTTTLTQAPSSSTSTTTSTTTNITKQNSTKSIITTTKSITQVVATDEDIIEYIKNTYNDIDDNTKNISSSVKEKFILIVDFIFYDGKIKGKTFNELKETGKAKVIYYALLIDQKISNKWPDYKNTLSSKYQDIKAKLLAKYMDLTTTICSKNQTGCNYVKEDFSLLKKSINITWDLLKSAFSYTYNKGVNYLKEWYEVFKTR